MENTIPMPAMAIGRRIEFNCRLRSSAVLKAAAPSAAVANIEPQYDS